MTNGVFLFGKCVIPFFCRALLLCGLGFAAARAGLLTLTVGAMLSGFAGLLLLNLFLCGGLLPLHLLPLRVATIGAYTPFGAACGLFAPLLSGNFSPQASATAVLYAAAAVLLAVRRLDRLVRNGGLTV